MKKIPGPVCSLIAACFFALGGLLIKLIPWSGMALNGIRCMIALPMLLVYMKAAGHRIIFNRTVLVGALCMVTTNILYALANKLTTAANTIILQFTAPIFVIVLSLLIFGKKPERMDVLACIFVFCGVVFFFVDGLSAGNMLGNVLAICSGVTYAGLFMMNTGKDADPLSSVVFGMLAGFVIGIPFMIMQDYSGATAGNWIAVLCLGIFQLGCAYIFFTEGLLTTPPITASLISGVEAILNPVLVAVFYHERITPLALAGAAIVFVSIMVYNVVKAMRKPAVRGRLHRREGVPAK